jgi:nucleoside-diphosphate-sugar epimerase
VSPLKEGVINTFSWNELDSIPPVDVIIHLAGKVHDTKNQSEAKDYFKINTGLTQKIYDWFLQSETKKFIFFSSVKAAAHKVEGKILTEDIIPSPKGPYGESKIAAENYILSHLPTTNYSLPTTNYQLKEVFILRPCMIHGPGNKGNLNLLYQLVKKGIPYPLGAFENRRSFTSVENLCFVISELIEKDIPDGIYNMGDDESLSTNELIELIAKTLNKPIRIWKWNKSFIQFCVKIGTVLHLPLNDEKLQKLTENYIVSNMKLKKALRMEKMPVRATNGFIKTIQSFEKK